MNRRDLTAVRFEVGRAASAWPAEPAYVWRRVLLAARAAETSGFSHALDVPTSWGSSGGLVSDSAIRRMASLPSLSALRLRNEENRRAISM